MYYLSSENKGADQLRVFVFAYAKCWFSPDAAQIYSLFCFMLVYAYSLRHFSCVMRKPTFCICENKDTDQLHGNCEADQRLCFHYIDYVQTLYFLNLKFQASSHLL